MFICENCGQGHNGSYGSGRFCSVKCSRGFSTKAKRKEINKRVSIKLKKLPEIYEKICPTCKDTFYTKNKKVKYCDTKKCYTRVITQKTKQLLRQRALENVKNGTHIGWQSRKIRSYAELFFEDVLKNHNLFERCDVEFKIPKRDLGINDHANYFVDFYFIDKKVALEIDGKQHKYPDRMKSDKIRDGLLKERLGITTYRIPWKNPNNDRNKEYIKSEIDKFLNFIK